MRHLQAIEATLMSAVRDTDKVSEHRLAVVKQGTKLNAIQIFGVLQTLALIKNKTLHGHTCVDTQGKSEYFILKLLAELPSTSDQNQI